MADQDYIDLTRYYVVIFKLNKRLNKFYLFCEYWKRMIRSRHICGFNFFSVFLDLMSILVFLF